MKINVSIAGIAALSLCGLATLSTSAFAQVARAAGKHHRAGGAKAAGQRRAPIGEAFKAIAPTADEQTKFDALYATYQVDAKTAFAASTDPAERRTKMMDLSKKFRSDVDALLTPDQQTKFKQELFVIPTMNSLDRALMLTPDEKSKIEPILSDVAGKVDGMKGKERKPLMDEAKAKIREVLTPEQQTKLDAMKGMNGGGGRRGPGAGAPAAVVPVKP
jgi:Spy/CpxP family protein refolding chaperone